MLKSKREGIWRGTKAKVKSYKFAKKAHPRSKQSFPQHVACQGQRGHPESVPRLGILGAPSHSLGKRLGAQGHPTSHPDVCTSILVEHWPYLG